MIGFGIALLTVFSCMMIVSMTLIGCGFGIIMGSLATK